MLPPPPDSKPFLVAVFDLLGFTAHLCDESGNPKAGGLSSLYEKYSLFLHVKADAVETRRVELISEEEISVTDFRIPHVVASDTVLMWSTVSDAPHLVRAAAHFVNLALTFSAPVRGALAYGDCIIEPSKGIYIGYPIVEALAAEKAQEWIGIGVLSRAGDVLSGVGGVVEYKVPLKPDRQLCLSHAIAWHWADDDPTAPGIRVQRLLQVVSDKHRAKYQNTLAFQETIGAEQGGLHRQNGSA